MKGAKSAARNEAIERAGRWLYGDAWIGELGKREWMLGKGSHDLPPAPKDAQRIARARLRSHASDEQFGVVFRWLQAAWNLDCSPSGFDAAKFEKFWATNLPAVATGKDARRDAVRSLWAAGQRPGNGGTCTWKKFTADVCSKCRATYEEKTIRRDVKELFGSWRPA